MRSHGHAVGYKTSPTLKSWQHMISRCLNPRNPKYPRYGGRGITVCERWLDFQSFLEDMGEKPKAGMSIGRVNNDGDYEPKNCRWETPKQQADNRPGFCHEFTYKEKKYNMKQLADKLGVPVHLLANRFRRGYTFKEMICTDHVKPGPKRRLKK